MNALNEQWLPVPEWEGVYEVSDIGRVRRIAPSNGHPGKMMTNTKLAHGYLVVRLRYRGKVGHPTVHSVVMAAFVGPRPKAMDINHKDGNRSNNQLCNLEYVTRSENHLHAYRVLGRANVGIGIGQKGEHNVKSVLTTEQVRAIRAEYIPGKISQQSLASKYGVSQMMIGLVVRRKNWTHV